MIRFFWFVFLLYYFPKKTMVCQKLILIQNDTIVLLQFTLHGLLYAFDTFSMSVSNWICSKTKEERKIKFIIILFIQNHCAKIVKLFYFFSSSIGWIINNKSSLKNTHQLKWDKYIYKYLCIAIHTSSKPLSLWYDITWTLKKRFYSSITKANS